MKVWQRRSPTMYALHGWEGHVLNEESIRQHPNQPAQLLPSAGALAQTLWVIDSDTSADGGALFLSVDSMKQRGACYWGSKA